MRKLQSWWYRCTRLQKPWNDTAMEMKWLLDEAQTWDKPRGLVWVSVLAVGPEILVHDEKWTCIKLVPVEVQFAPIPGSDMEDVPAAHDTRQATATLRYECNSGIPTNCVLFNLTPDQAIEQSRGKWVRY